MRGDLEGLGGSASVSHQMELIEETLATLQTLEPAGVFARDLAECLTLQLKDKNRFDPGHRRPSSANLDLLAARDLWLPSSAPVTVSR